MRFANEYGFCELNTFPGCNQIVVSNHAYVYPEYRSKGNGRANNKKRTQRAREMGYDLMLCTVRVGNAAQEAILQKEGWDCLTGFTNRETGHRVRLWCKKLNPVDVGPDRRRA